MALVHDWLTGYRGGERVLHRLAQRFPDADLYTLFHRPGSTTPEIEARRIVTSALDRLPGAHDHYRKLLPLFPWAIRQFDLRGYDLVLSTSHAVAKSVRVPAGVPHLDYCFTPMRYVWDQSDAYLGRGPRRWLASPLTRSLQRFDLRTSGPESVTRFVAISREVASRIERHYGRSARVVHPPVDISWIDLARDPAEDFFLLVGGFVPYKNESLVIEAFRRSGRRLVIVGDGPMRARLTRDLPDHIECLGRVDDATLADLYRRARALIYPQREDFGLVALEAQAAGRPVIAFGAGGVLDTIRPLPEERRDHPVEPHAASVAHPTGPARRNADDFREMDDPTGLFFHEQTPRALERAIERFEKTETRFEPARLRRWAESFSPSRFDAAFEREIDAVLERKS